jgi:hypothetical protein
MKIVLRTIGLLSFLILNHAACTRQQGVLESTKNYGAGTTVSAPSTQANDRPTETGAGVPGYLVGCSLITIGEQIVEVGCGLVDANGNATRGDADAWNRYSMALPATAPATVSISKRAADMGQPMDVVFGFTGASQQTLTEIASLSTYAYEYTDESGQKQKIESTAPKATTLPPPPTTPTAALTCSSGVVMDGVCYFRTEQSCTAACSALNSVPHASVADRFGMGSEDNKSQCRMIYAKLKNVDDPDDLRFSDNRGAGLGCYENMTGRVVFDQNPTDLTLYPPFGGSVLCGCQ